MLSLSSKISSDGALCLLISPELGPQGPDCLLLLTDLPLQPGNLPLHSHGDLRLLSHKLGHVHLILSCLTFLSDELMELNVIIVWTKVLGAEADDTALESLEVVVTAMVMDSLGLVSLLRLPQKGVSCLDSQTIGKVECSAIGQSA